jgi:hypothetical protein
MEEWMDGRIDGRMDGLMDRCMDGFLHVGREGLIIKWMDELMYGYIYRNDGSMNGCMDLWIGGWFDGRMGVGMNGWMVSISETILALARLD